MNLLARSACKETRTELSFIDQGLYNWDPVSSLCFMTFLFPEQKLRVTEAGSFSLPTFSRGKMFLYKYKVHPVSRVPVIVPLIQVEVFREISHWECWKYHVRATRFQNFLGEHFPPPPTPLRNQSRLYCGCSSLLLAVPRITIFVEKTDETRRPQVHVERFMFPLPTTTDSLSAP